MKTKSMVRRNGLRAGMGALFCILLLTVGLVFGTGTSTSAKAADAHGWHCNVVYTESENKITVSGSYSGAIDSVSEPINIYVSFRSGSRGWGYTNYFWRTQLSGFSFSILLSGNEFFAGGCEYTVSVTFQDEESKETDYYQPPYYVVFSNIYTFTIPGEIVPLPDDPVKEGHHFVGWYYDEALTQPYDNAPIYADTQLYAKFEINTYTVTYDTDHGTAVSPATVNWNTAAPTPETTCAGYNFVGWFLPDGTQYTNQPITADTTLTAHWEVKMYTVTFYLDGAVYTSLQVPYGAPLGKVMSDAKVASYQPLDSYGVRVSRQSAITEDTNVLIHELTGWEKYGDFVGRSPWYTWLMVGLGGALALAFSICVVLLVKWRK